MIKLIGIAFSLAGLGLLFTNCKGGETSKTEVQKADSIKAMENAQMVKPNSEYIITPPDADYTGDYVDKYPGGIIKVTGFFRFGQRHGQWMYFYDNGIKWSECFYDKGKRHGESIVYFPNGQVQYKGWFKNDLRDSLWFFYDDKGKEVDKRAYRNDEETGLVN